MRGRVRAAVAAVVTTAAVEAASWTLARAHRAPAPAGPAPARVAIVVLGYPARRDGRPHPVQRWRVAMACRTWRSTGASHVVFCGGAVRSARPEAEDMAQLALAGGMPESVIVRERTSRSTRENVVRARELVGAEGTVLLVSDPFHARRARARWIEHFPEDAGRVRYGVIHRPFERLPLKAASAAFEVVLGLRRSILRRVRP